MTVGQCQSVLSHGWLMAGEAAASPLASLAPASTNRGELEVAAYCASAELLAWKQFAATAFVQMKETVGVLKLSVLSY